MHFCQFRARGDVSGYFYTIFPGSSCLSLVDRVTGLDVVQWLTPCLRSTKLIDTKPG